jgi:hypothetical protein
MQDRHHQLEEILLLRTASPCKRVMTDTIQSEHYESA